ncbi:uncharacterized protein LOC133296742 [Gastrolobium bilobum]|uniref:uncharacterized protein LOC133296742 n=1 Tax=Gastrolobium bilobum TaxID=150636 RepID=UPI002AB19012|nr:uncharacterized protein LOC133296742 [Gastrolobium bilobum]
MESRLDELASMTVPNPKGTGNVSAISLRSGKQLEEPNQSAVESSQGGDTGSRKQNTDTSDVHILLPFPQRATQSKKQAAKAQDKEILDTFRKVEVNIPLLDAIQQIPRFAMFLKELCTNKRRLKGDERVSSLGLGPLRATGIVVQLANNSVHPSGVVEDILVRVNNLIFPADFYVLGMEGEIPSSTIILGRPFMKTARTKIDVHAELSSFLDSDLSCGCTDSSNCTICAEIAVCCSDVNHALNDDLHSDIDVNVFSVEPAPARLLPSTEQPPKLELKVLPDHLKYSYLEENEQLHVIVAKNLIPEQEEKLLTLLKERFDRNFCLGFVLDSWIALLVI